MGQVNIAISGSTQRIEASIGRTTRKVKKMGDEFRKTALHTKKIEQDTKKSEQHMKKMSDNLTRSGDSSRKVSDNTALIQGGFAAAAAATRVISAALGEHNKLLERQVSLERELSEVRGGFATLGNQALSKDLKFKATRIAPLIGDLPEAGRLTALAYAAGVIEDLVDFARLQTSSIKPLTGINFAGALRSEGIDGLQALGILIASSAKASALPEQVAQPLQNALEIIGDVKAEGASDVQAVSTAGVGISLISRKAGPAAAGTQVESLLQEAAERNIRGTLLQVVDRFNIMIAEQIESGEIVNARAFFGRKEAFKGQIALTKLRDEFATETTRLDATPGVFKAAAKEFLARVDLANVGQRFINEERGAAQVEEAAGAKRAAVQEALIMQRKRDNIAAGPAGMLVEGSIAALEFVGFNPQNLMPGHNLSVDMVMHARTQAAEVALEQVQRVNTRKREQVEAIITNFPKPTPNIISQQQSTPAGGQ